MPRRPFALHTQSWKRPEEYRKHFGAAKASGTTPMCDGGQWLRQTWTRISRCLLWGNPAILPTFPAMGCSFGGHTLHTLQVLQVGQAFSPSRSFPVLPVFRRWGLGAPPRADIPLIGVRYIEKFTRQNAWKGRGNASAPVHIGERSSHGICGL